MSIQSTPKCALYMTVGQLLVLCLVFFPRGFSYVARVYKERGERMPGLPSRTHAEHKPKELTRKFSGGREASVLWIGDEKVGGS